jgi:hypothetical protein
VRGKNSKNSHPSVAIEEGATTMNSTTVFTKVQTIAGTTLSFRWLADIGLGVIGVLTTLSEILLLFATIFITIDYSEPKLLALILTAKSITFYLSLSQSAFLILPEIVMVHSIVRSIHLRKVANELPSAENTLWYVLFKDITIAFISLTVVTLATVFIPGLTAYALTISAWLLFPRALISLSYAVTTGVMRLQSEPCLRSLFLERSRELDAARIELADARRCYDEARAELALTDARLKDASKQIEEAAKRIDEERKHHKLMQRTESEVIMDEWKSGKYATKRAISEALNISPSKIQRVLKEM